MERLTRFGLALAVAIGLSVLPVHAAQYGGGHKKTKGEHSMTGCLQKGDAEGTYKLTHVEGSGPKTVEITEMASGVDLASHVGHKVEITGTTVKARAAAKEEGTSGTKGSMKKERREHHMKVDSVKMISENCS